MNDQPPILRSYRVDVQVVPFGRWASNGLRFATRDGAKVWAECWAVNSLGAPPATWTRAFQIVPSTDVPNMPEPEPPHDCRDHAIPYASDGALGHGWECGKCGAFLQAG